MKKMPGDIIIFHMCTKSNDHMMYSSWNMMHDRWTDRQTEGQMDGWMEKVTYRGGCPT